MTSFFNLGHSSLGPRLCGSEWKRWRSVGVFGVTTTRAASFLVLIMQQINGWVIIISGCVGMGARTVLLIPRLNPAGLNILF